MDFEKLIKKEKPLITVFTLILSLSVLDAIFTPTSFVSAFKVTFGIFIYLILPGYKMLYTFKLNDLERVILSVPVSAATVPIVSYYLALAGLKVSFLNSAVSIILIILLAEIYIHRKSISDFLH